MRIAAELITAYSFKQPFHLWLQEVFRQNRQFGSKDRKFYRDVFYAYWRLGNFGSDLSTEQRLLAGLIRLQPENPQYTELMTELIPDCKSAADFEAIQQHTGEKWNPYKPFAASISDKIDLHKLNVWFGRKAPVWIKINGPHRQEIIGYLQRKSAEFVEFENNLIKTGNENLDDVLIKGWCRIQDLGSQESLNTEILAEATLIWDACCGAGGKSLLACDLIPEATLYISDTRSQMVHNALQRFSAEGKPLPFSGTVNLSLPTQKLVFDDSIHISKPVFDSIICDVPCSGSGTWRRNPEMLSAFSDTDLNDYSLKQRSIAKNAAAFLKTGGKLIYLTCSVFKEENELNARVIAENTGLKLISEEYCGGYEKDADFIFRAVFSK